MRSHPARTVRVVRGLSRGDAHIGMGRLLPTKGDALAKPNFQFQKRQKELEKKKKQEEKRLRKLERHAVPATDPLTPPESGEAPTEQQ